MRETAFISMELGWTGMLLIPNGNTDTYGIGLIEVVWKEVEAAIDTWIKQLVHFTIFCTVFAQGTGQGPQLKNALFLVSLDLRKAYGKLDRGRLLQTIAGYGAGPKIQVFIAEIWLRQEVFTHHNGFHDTHS